MTLLEDIQAEIATLTRVSPTPAAPFDYGTDLDCVDDMTEHADEIPQNSPRAIVQASARRLSTARGTLLDDQDYGLDIRDWCNRGVPESEFIDLAGQIELELTKDDRIDSVQVNVSRPATNAFDVEIVFTPVGLNKQPFSATLAVVDGELMVEALT